MKEVHREEKLQAFGGFFQNLGDREVKNEERVLQASFTPILPDKKAAKIQLRDIDFRNESQVSPL